MCLPWLAWVVPEVLAVIDIIIYAVSGVMVSTQNERPNTSCDKIELQDARYAIWAGFGLSVILSFIVFGTLSAQRSP